MVERLRQSHAASYQRFADRVRPLPGARELLAWLTEAGIPWAIATSGRMDTAAVNLAALGVDPSRVPVVTRDQVKYAKPDPDLFLAAADRIGAAIETAVVVGDSIWDILAAARCKRSGSGCSAAATAPTSCATPAHSASMMTRPICCATSTRSAAGARAIRGKMGRSPGRGPDKSRARRWPNDKRRSRQSSAPCSRGVPP